MSDGMPVQGASVEVVRPCGEAWNRMKAVLFPFNFERWITLGFVAWLGLLGQAGLGSGINFPGGNPFGAHHRPNEANVRQMIEQAMAYVESHLTLVLGLAGAGMVVMLAITIGLMYLSSRGTFMYLDCVHRGRAAVVEPWRRSRRPAGSYFLWRLLFGGIGWVVLLTALALAVALTWPDLRHLEFPRHAIMTYVVIGVFLFPVLLALGLVRWLMWALLAPVMYLRDVPGREAWREVFALIAREPAAVVLYMLFSIPLGLLAGLAMVVAGCCTCCLGFLPVLSQTITQPVLFWIRGYSFHFLAQFGPQYPLQAGLVVADTTAPPSAGQAGPRIVSCPACGQPYQVPGNAPGIYACAKCGGRFEVM